MSRSSALARGRRVASEGFTDACVVTRAGSGKGEFNDETGQYDPPARIEIYVGKCRIQVTSVIANSSESTAGERATIVQGSEWQGPIAGTDEIAINDVIRIDSSANDPALTGRTFTVSARHEKTHATSRRLRVQEVTG